MRICGYIPAEQIGMTAAVEMAAVNAVEVTNAGWGPGSRAVTAGDIAARDSVPLLTADPRVIAAGDLLAERLPLSAAPLRGLLTRMSGRCGHCSTCSRRRPLDPTAARQLNQQRRVAATPSHLDGRRAQPSEENITRYVAPICAGEST